MELVYGMVDREARKYHAYLPRKVVGTRLLLR